MQSLWSDSDAEAMVARYAASGVGRDLALRVYTSRLLGGDPRLVLHGGGNTSVKAVQPDAAERCADLYGPRVGVVPYIMPGFLLAKKAAEVFEAEPAVHGLVLLKHGVFSFGDSAHEAYERMIAIVTLAEERLARGRKSLFAAAALPSPIASIAEVAPILRGACALPAEPAGEYRRFVLDFRGGPAVLNFVNGEDVHRYALEGVATPDHTIRTKNYPVIVPAPEAGRLDDFAAATREAVADFIGEYHDYFTRHNATS